MILLDSFAFLLGLIIVSLTLLSAVRTLVLPRAAPDPLVRIVFLSARKVFGLVNRRLGTYERQDRLMAFYGPLTLLVLLPVWLILVTLGFMFMFWATGVRPLAEAYTVSGSSLLTLGFARGEGFLNTSLAFAEASIGLILVALLIAYLPATYSAFSERERRVTMLETYAGAPPSAVEMLLRINRIGRLTELGAFWEEWTEWFAAIDESHTSLAFLVFFRSPIPEHSWVNAAGTVLDGGALLLSSVDIPFNPRIAICLRAGYLALRRIADYFRVPYAREARFPDDPISITREEFDEAWEEFARVGLPLKGDRDQAWLDFAGWRVNYDAVLLALASLTMAPTARWTSDRAPRFNPVRFRLKR